MSNKEEVLVSIPILTYNGEKYIKEQLDSIYNQSYKNIEVLVFDDCSTDNTAKILEEYHLSHGLKYVVNKKNLGLRENSLLAFKACTGEYIASADQDDKWKEHKIELLVQNMHDNVMVYTDSIPIDETGKELAPYYFQQYLNLIEGDNNKLFFFTNCISAHAMLFKRELLEYMYQIPKEMFYHDWWLAFIAASYGKIKFIDEPLIYYRRHEEQLTKNKDKNYTFFSRVKEREQNILKNRENIIKALQSFSTLSLIDEDTKSLLEKLTSYFETFETSYFNKDLYTLLLQYKDEFFAMTKDTTTQKAAKKLSRGIWYYRLKFYT